MELENNESAPEVYDLGWWPEILGVFGVALLLWYLITYARGTL